MIVGVMSDIVITMISLISCHLHFLTSEHFGGSVETLRSRMTDIVNISQSLISVDSHYEFIAL